jgi:hypothetical protein
MGLRKLSLKLNHAKRPPLSVRIQTTGPRSPRDGLQIVIISQRSGRSRLRIAVIHILVRDSPVGSFGRSAVVIIFPLVRSAGTLIMAGVRAPCRKSVNPAVAWAVCVGYVDADLSAVAGSSGGGGNVIIFVSV